jgi:hypothetical protein
MPWRQRARRLCCQASPCRQSSRSRR